MRLRAAWPLLLALCLASCGGCGAPTPTPVPAESPAPAPEASADDAARLLGRIRAVDLDGDPLPGMVPIATTAPNAFDAPIAQGAPTDANGDGALWLPPEARVFVRAWDPAMARFANNFYDVLPAEHGETELMVIQMVEGCAVTLRVADDRGQPLAGAAVELMMLHPTQGPWWPARAEADAGGTVQFPRVPAGAYGFRVEADGRALDLPQRMLPPGGTVDLGELRLQ